MAETLFSFDKNNYQDCQERYRGDNKQEYYLGDYTIEAGSVIDVRADKKSVGSCSIINLYSKTRLTFNRSWYHIRQDATDVVVLWFVKSGALRIANSTGTAVANAGDFAITKSMTPFTIDCLVGSDSHHEVLHVLIPAHVFRQYIPHEVVCGFTAKASGRIYSIAENILTEILEDNGELSDVAQQILLNSALSVISDTIKDCDNLTKERQSIADQRLQDVLRYIEIHLSDPKLSTSMVADACGISPRYLSSLLKQKGTSFSEHIWEQRLKIASRWLASTKPNEISIAEVAFRVGFKSPAHFSRMFKRVYQKGPREYRSDCLAKVAQTHQDVFAANNSSTLQ